jgi:hypothetical protein
VCPSEASGGAWPAGTDYAASFGPQWNCGDPSSGAPQNGAFAYQTAVPLAAFTDGLSNTVTVLEVVRGDLSPRIYRGDVYDNQSSAPSAAMTFPANLTQLNTYISGEVVSADSY